MRTRDGCRIRRGRITIAGKTIGLPPSTAIFSAKAPACLAGRVIRMPRPQSGPRFP
jgi:hypothetical protein